MRDRFLPGVRFFCAVSTLALLSGCATLPSSGPTARQVERGAKDKASTIPFAVVDLDATTMKALVESHAAVPTAGAFAAMAHDGTVDRIAPGDELMITVYEVGMTLFGGPQVFGGEAPAVGRKMSSVTVESDGTIRLPYIGRLAIAGSRPSDVQRMIEQALVGKSQSPQAIVTVVSSPRNSVYLFGDVLRAGRLPLTVARERLLDAVATSGGGKQPSSDMVVRLTRDGTTAEMRLADVRAGGPDDVELLPGDHIELVGQPQSFSVFGAARVSEVPFAAPRVSLAEALARVGGPSEVQADPSAVFLFRYDAAAVAAGQRPTIYRLNLMRPESYIIAQNIAMRDKDLIYIANSASGPVTKFIGVLNQLFAPVFTVRSLTTTQ